MKNRVKVTQTKFCIDEENKVVVCELKVDMQMDKNPAWEFMDWKMWNKTFPHVSAFGIFTVKGKARCNSADTFDIKKGKMIAEGRAKAKMFNIASKVWRACCDEFLRLSNECIKSSNNCHIAKSVEEVHLEELTK